jgi:hypothetical protein
MGYMCALQLEHIWCLHVFAQIVLKHLVLSYLWCQFSFNSCMDIELWAFYSRTLRYSDFPFCNQEHLILSDISCEMLKQCMMKREKTCFDFFCC